MGSGAILYLGGGGGEKKKKGGWGVKTFKKNMPLPSPLFAFTKKKGIK